nr:M56 family metallopeptidase [Hyphomonas sp. Mor2]
MSWTEFHPLVQEAILTTFAVGVLVLLVLVIRKPFAMRFGAKAAYLLWALPLARFVTPPLPGNWSLAGLLGFNRPTPVEETAAVNEWVWNPAAEVTAHVSVEADTAFTEPSVFPIPDAAAPTAAMGPSLLEAILAQAPLILTCVWFTGMVLWLGRSLYQQRQFLWLIKADSEPAEAATIAETARIAKQLGIKRVPDVRASLLCSGPLVTGLTKPVILLPMWFEEDYDAAERRDALVHELMHLKRRDLWAFQAAHIVAATQWFNPLAHVALHAFRTDQEAACDADVITRAKLSPAAYGRTLVKAARLARPSDRRIAAASLTLAHPIKERLIMMTHPTPTLRSRLMGGTLAVALGAGAIFATASCTSSVAQELDGAPQEQALNEDESHNVIVVDGTSDMSFAFTIDGETFSFDMADMPPMPPMPEMPAMPGFDGMAFEQDGNSFHFEFDTEKLKAMEDSPEFAEWEAKMEAWGEEMDAWGDVVEERAEAWAEQMEPQIERWAELHSENIENQIELMIERSELQAERAERLAERAQAQVDREAARADRKNIWIMRAHGDDEVSGGVEAPETRDFGNSDFEQVEVGSGISMVYTQDPNPSVTATLSRGSWDQVDVSVEDGTLTAKRKQGSNWGRRGPSLVVYAASPSLTSVDTASGAAFNGNVVATDLDVDASSGSSVSIEGACQTLNLDASSGSSISLEKLECTDAVVDASSGSSIRIYASTSVDVDASSGSIITVSGSPKDVTKDTSSGATVRIK